MLSRVSVQKLSSFQRKMVNRNDISCNNEAFDVPLTINFFLNELRGRDSIEYAEKTRLSNEIALLVNMAKNSSTKYPAKDLDSKLLLDSTDVACVSDSTSIIGIEKENLIRDLEKSLTFFFVESNGIAFLSRRDMKNCLKCIFSSVSIPRTIYLQWIVKVPN